MATIIMEKRRYVLVQGNIACLGDAIRKYDDLKSLKMVCCCSNMDYLKIKDDRIIKKSKVAFLINEHGQGLHKKLFTKDFFNVIWAMKNRYFSSKAFEKCKHVLLCYGEQGKVTVNFSKIIEDVYSEEMEQILDNHPKMVLRRRGTAVRGIYSDILFFAAPLRFAYENGLDVFFDMK